MHLCYVKLYITKEEATEWKTDRPFSIRKTVKTKKNNLVVQFYEKKVCLNLLITVGNMMTSDMT